VEGRTGARVTAAGWAPAARAPATRRSPAPSALLTAYPSLIDARNGGCGAAARTAAASTWWWAPEGAWPRVSKL